MKTASDVQMPRCAA